MKGGYLQQSVNFESSCNEVWEKMFWSATPAISSTTQCQNICILFSITYYLLRFFSMKNLIDYFTDREIIKLLCKYRIQHARKRHKIHLMRDISYHPKTNKIDNERYKCPDELNSLLPNRKSWIRLRKKEREKTENSQEVILKSLISTTNRIKENCKENKPDWLLKLELFIQNIQSSIKGENPIHLSRPEVVPLKKTFNDTSKEYRPIAVYSIRDRIIISLTSKYLMELFDDFFSENSYAFRKKENKNHHFAVEAILEHKRKYSNTDFWVTECDIKKFYDSVNHRIIKQIFLSFVKKIEKENKKFDERASDVFFEFLSSYCFNVNVLPLNNDDDFFKQYELPTGIFKWIDTGQIYPDGITGERIGVPQGGALSCLIANLLLDNVDKKVCQSNDDSQLLYLRYCDDMIIMHSDKKKCENALRRYKRGISKSKLLFHDDKETPKYGKDFWDEDFKSKKPYKWAEKNDAQNVPWVSFVGYQVRHDLNVRVRKKSIKKEVKKQRRETNNVLQAIDAKKNDALNVNSRKSLKQISYSLNQRLISMSVGRVKLHNYETHKYSFSWANGFKILTDNPTSKSQLRFLDKSREKQNGRLRKKITLLTKKNETPDIQESGVHEFYGTPFSYYGYLRNKDENK
jgi:Reverse transcriptase (RNA-dependent DNA polymerase)